MCTLVQVVLYTSQSNVLPRPLESDYSINGQHRYAHVIITTLIQK